MTSECHRAILLLGPTGSGKTPLGELIERRGLWRMRCTHFDFGANLRQHVEEDLPDDVLSRADLDFLREVLESGVLLEDRHFPLAERILRSFLRRCPLEPDTVVLLNGLPRHVGQARAIEAFLAVEAAIHLRCSVEIIVQRIRANVGGDRGQREDDDPQAIRQKAAIFHSRSLPLLAYYRSRGARIETVDVAAETTAEDVWNALARPRGQDTPVVLPRPPGSQPG